MSLRPARQEGSTRLPQRWVLSETTNRSGVALHSSRNLAASGQQLGDRFQPDLGVQSDAPHLQPPCVADELVLLSMLAWALPPFLVFLL